MVRILFVCVFVFVGVLCVAQQRVFIIPKPSQVEEQQGVFGYNSNTIVYFDKDFKAVASLVADLMKLPAVNLRARNKAVVAGTGAIVLQSSARKMDEEAYSLSIDANRVVVMASGAMGAINAIQSLSQLVFTSERPGTIPCAVINDKPRFAYRGFMLDVSRHFYPQSFVNKLIDLLSLYKINRLHLHLTDAAGWRLEIKKYPKLTANASWRTDRTWKEWWKSGMDYSSEGAPMAYGGYYTQADARAMVAYAARKGITIIPEIEMPGHSEEVIAAYPELKCINSTDRQGEFCIGTDSTFTFMQDVITEVMSIFPSSYIHIGGDEASTQHWKKCSRCQQRMKDNKLKDEKELQSYAIRRMEKFIAAKGRKLLGWDEILEGGLAPGATVMSWRGEKGGIEAASMDHDVIMTPGSFCYFDAYQQDPVTQPEAIGGFLPLKKVYSYEPIPAGLEATKHKYIKGAQANLWTEYIPTVEHAEYMIFPRIIALSEAVWSDAHDRNWEDFQSRLFHHYLLLQQLQVNYCRPSDQLEIKPAIDVNRKSATITISSEQYQPQIAYKTDGTLPAEGSPLYKGPFPVTGSSVVRAAVIRDGKLHRAPDSVDIDFHLALGKKVIYNQPYSESYPAQKESTLVNGYRGTLTYQDGQWQGLTNDLDVTIDLEKSQEIGEIKSTFMQVTGPGVYIPDYVEVFSSTDGKEFKSTGKVMNDIPTTDVSLRFKTFVIDQKGREARYIRLYAKLHDGFMFVDEVRVGRMKNVK